MSDARDEALYETVARSSHGYYELKDAYRKPMQTFYENVYYQDEKSVYQNRKYDAAELEYKTYIFKEKETIVTRQGCGGQSRNFLDIGCGEGYALAYFKKHGWNVCGIDLSEHGLMTHNPEMRRYLMKGDYEECIRILRDAGNTYDFINADFVLEHVKEPELFFSGIKGICERDTIVCVKVPNDFSVLQRRAYELGCIETPFWVTAETGEHLNYFSAKSLISLGNACGFEEVEVIADWPIDFFLFHPAANYQKRQDVGKDCHFAKVTMENMLFAGSVEKTVKLHEAIADAGCGREISVYFKLDVNL